MLTFRSLLGVAALLVLTGIAYAAISITSLGTAAPPGTYFTPGGDGPFPLIPAIDDTSPIFAEVTSAPLAPGKNVLFSIPLSHRSIGAGWQSWSHGYTGDLYYTNGKSSVTLSFDQEDIQAFYLYAEPNILGSHPMTFAATDDAGASQSITNDVSGPGGTMGVLVVTEGLSKISSITVSMLDGVDFAIGEFGWAKTIPAPGALALLGLAGLISRRRRS